MSEKKLSKQLNHIYLTVMSSGISAVGAQEFRQVITDAEALEAKLSKMEDWAKLQRQLVADIKDDLGVPSSLAGEIRPAIRELQADNTALRKLNDASIELYCGVISKTEWRIAVRNSPKGQELIALAGGEEA